VSRSLLLLGLTLAAGPVPPAPPSAHDLHLTHTRLVLDGATVGARIRLFHDDLQVALRLFSGDSTLQLTSTQRHDSLFAAYARGRLHLTLDRDSVLLRVTGSGAETDPASQQVVWYVLEGEVPRPARHLDLLNGLLFEVYRDQQNIVQLLHLPGEERRTLYFTATDARDQQLEF